MRFSVEGELLQNLINYMANRPYAEVAALLDQLQKDAIVIESTEEESNDESKEA